MRVWVCGDFDLGGEGGLVCALEVLVSGMMRGLGVKVFAGDAHHHYEVLDAVGEAFVAAFLPVGCGGGSFA